MLKIKRKPNLSQMVGGEKIFTKEAFDAARRRINEAMRGSIRGGLIVERSPCCGAPIGYTRGGVSIPYCSKCKRDYREVYLK